VLKQKEPSSVEAAPEGISTNGKAIPAHPARLTRRFWDLLRERETLLWWLHSLWSLLFGLAVMLVGARKPSYVRVIVCHIAFIWATSFFLPVLLRTTRLSPKWTERLRLVINYFNRNFYQQLLFFVIPIYYASTTLSSRNVAFLGMLCLSAVLSTLDLVYDRYLSVRWRLNTLFLAFNSFAGINVMLLVLFALRTETALYISGLCAAAIFTSMLYRFSQFRGWRLLGAACAAVAATLAALYLGASFIPPVMLSLGNVSFGSSINRATYQMIDPIVELPADYAGRLTVVTPIKAPYGFTARVEQKWYLDGDLYARHPKQGYMTIPGGRKEGFRYWSYITLRKDSPPRVVRVDVLTSSGQLIGRAVLHRAKDRGSAGK